jgi:hypothetical protein
VTNAVLALAVLIAVAIELIVPGAKLYHTGWYNVALFAVALVLALRARGVARSLRTLRSWIGMALAGFGLAAVALAGVSFGLFAPDTQSVVGAPGTSQSIDGVLLEFPLSQEGVPMRSYSGAFLLRPQPRTVVGVDVADAAGRHLTTTQPNGTAFLSPVLLMQASQSFGGFDLPYDTFAVPAARRIVKAVLLTPEAIANMPALNGTPAAVLFDVEDEREAQVARGIGVARDGVPIALGGLRLRANLLNYPAIELIALPNPLVVLLGLIATVVGITLLWLDARREPEVA